MRPLTRLVSFVLLACAALAQTSPTPPAPPKRIPPPGITLTDTERAELSAGASALRGELDALTRELADDARLRALLPDVEIFHKAVAWALHYDEFMAPKEIGQARASLEQGRRRAAQLRARQAPWLDATGLVVRGYRSTLDGSVQPYGLLVPETLRRAARETPLMVWLLGRGERRTELAFLAEREAGPPHLTPHDTLVLIPYGRFCNATKFAGEVDVSEAMRAVGADYRIDPRRILVAGFSMGGGSVWHLATHYSGIWCAASPGAGFAETPIFTKALAPGREPRTWWEQKLWRQYEATGVAANLLNCPTVAYSGELDPQKQAADLMAEAMAKEGLTLERFIGPQTGHRYHPETKAALTQRLEALLARGRNPEPREVWLATYTLRYPEAAWIRIEGMGRHWERAEARATLHDNNLIRVETKNVTAIAFPGVHAATVQLDGEDVHVSGGELRFSRQGERWHQGIDERTRRKRPGLTGPIDDAFMEPFLFVRPTGKPLHPQPGGWVESELTAARHLWRDVFRGEAPVKSDRDVTDADIAERNLILWGDPGSNALLARILAQLPIAWDAQALTFRGQRYDPKHHAPILVFPNPLNPRRYLVLNSGITLRAEGYGNNALQTPKLPDWAVVDLRTPPGPRWPGKVVDAGFFDEEWK
jgi:dienelactone hydrolase